MTQPNDLIYSEFVDSRFKKMGTFKADLIHAAMGISTEAGELLDPVKKHYAYNKELDLDNLVEELGDLLFYIQALCNLLGISMGVLMRTNVEKLTKRYPTGYTDSNAIARMDKQ